MSHVRKSLLDVWLLISSITRYSDHFSSFFFLMNLLFHGASIFFSGWKSSTLQIDLHHQQHDPTHGEVFFSFTLADDRRLRLQIFTCWNPSLCFFSSFFIFAFLSWMHCIVMVFVMRSFCYLYFYVGYVRLVFRCVLCKSVCPFVGRSVRPLIGHSWKLNFWAEFEENYQEHEIMI